jgi:hypothetical protein
MSKILAHVGRKPREDLFGGQSCETLLREKPLETLLGSAFLKQLAFGVADELGSINRHRETLHSIVRE